jgi:GDPmannose 4,6-dehydratase
MWKMMQQKIPVDYVICSGKTHTVKNFINESTKYLKLKTKWVGKDINQKLINLENNKVIIKINRKLFRPSEVNLLRGDSSLAKRNIKWETKTDLKKLIKIMIDEELLSYNEKLY